MQIDAVWLPLQRMKSKQVNTIGHVAAWLFFFGLIFGFTANPPGGEQSWTRIFNPYFLGFYFIFISLFYLNYHVLIPQFYFRKKHLVYFIIIIALFLLVAWLKPFEHLLSGDKPPGQPGSPPLNDPGPRGKHEPFVDITSMILFIAVWSLSTAIFIIRQWRFTEKRALQAEADKTNAELAFLKSQVNPHFLFNTLNNIYSLALTKNENTAPSIMKLSNIMRYITDEGSEHFVPLESEVACMNDYIDLQRLRLGDKMNITVNVKGDFTDKSIPPLLLMTFIENVFKYGISSHESSEIRINLDASDHTITFFCSNKLFDTKRNVERTGIGIENARKRLQHLYPGKHFLDIKKDNGMFTVQLTLKG